MDFNEYIILDIGKIMIDFSEWPAKYYKVDGNQIFYLTDSELNVLKDGLLTFEFGVYNSEKLERIAKANPDLKKDYVHFIDFLEDIESMIPVGCHDNFYRNLKTLHLKLNFDEIRHDKSIRKKDAVLLGGYNAINNSLFLNPDGLKKLLGKSRDIAGNDKIFFREMNATIFHELLHMASSYFDKSKNIDYCGFDIDDNSKTCLTNRALTEGMTDYLTIANNPQLDIKSSSYYQEILFTKQLMLLVGSDLMMRAYFKGDGINSIKSKLMELDGNLEKADMLFKKIEYSFILNKSRMQTVTATVQKTLIDYFGKKIDHDLREGVLEPQTIIRSVDAFEQALLTPDKIDTKQQDSSKYIGLRESIRAFEKVKMTIVDCYETPNRLK